MLPDACHSHPVIPGLQLEAHPLLCMSREVHVVCPGLLEFLRVLLFSVFIFSSMLLFEVVVENPRGDKRLGR